MEMTPKGRPQEVFLIPRAHSTEKVFSVKTGQCSVYSVRRMDLYDVEHYE